MDTKQPIYLPKEILSTILKFRRVLMMKQHKDAILSYKRTIKFKSKCISGMEDYIWRTDCKLTKTIERVFCKIFSKEKNAIGTKTREKIANIIEDEEICIFSQYDYNHKLKKITNTL
mgnify:CR=1 FL=1